MARETSSTQEDRKSIEQTPIGELLRKEEEAKRAKEEKKREKRRLKKERRRAEKRAEKARKLAETESEASTIGETSTGEEEARIAQEEARVAQEEARVAQEEARVADEEEEEESRLESAEESRSGSHSPVEEETESSESHVSESTSPHSQKEIESSEEHRSVAPGTGPVLPPHRKKKRHYNSFKSYTHKVLKQVHPDTGMGSGSEELMTKITNELLFRIGEVAVDIAHHRGVSTVSSRDVQAGVRLILPGELKKHAVSEGTKAVTKYTSSNTGSKQNRISKSNRSGLEFSISRIESILRNQVLRKHNNLSQTASVYLAGVLEYLTAEILELAGNAARDNKRSRIIPRHIFLAIMNDEELGELFARQPILGVGTIQGIHSILNSSKKKKSQQGGAQSVRGSGSKTTRKAYHDSIQGLTKPVFKRILARGGVKFISGLIYEELRGVSKVLLENLVRAATIVCEGRRAKTITQSDYELAARTLGVSTISAAKQLKAVRACVGRRSGKKHTTRESEDEQEGGRKFHPGTVSLRNIRKYQKSNCFFFPRAAFKRLIHEISDDYSGVGKFRQSEDGLIYAQAILEYFLVEIANAANLVAIHSKRKTIMPKDISLVRNLGYRTLGFDRKQF